MLTLNYKTLNGLRVLFSLCHAVTAKLEQRSFKLPLLPSRRLPAEHFCRTHIPSNAVLQGSEKSESADLVYIVEQSLAYA